MYTYSENIDFYEINMYDYINLLYGIYSRENINFLQTIYVFF